MLGVFARLTCKLNENELQTGQDGKNIIILA
jgi:hypothetical protein